MGKVRAKSRKAKTPYAKATSNTRDQRVARLSCRETSTKQSPPQPHGAGEGPRAACTTSSLFVVDHVVLVELLAAASRSLVATEAELISENIFK